MVAPPDRGARPTVERSVRVSREADSPLEDPMVLDEIELYGELVIAASGSDQPLSQNAIDEVLGVEARGEASPQ